MTYYQSKSNAFISYEKGVKPVKSTKPYSIPKRKDKANTGLSHGIKAQWGYKSQVDMFEDMWSRALKEGKGKVICPFTNKDLTHYADGQMSFWLACFAHVLNKKNYPYYKLNPSNVVIVNPLFHSIVDCGRFSERLKYAEWKFFMWDKLVEDKKREYAEFIKLNN
jgi:hypothetical protein